MPAFSPAVTGILLKLAATMAFTGMSSLVRLAGQTLPIGQIVFCRAFFALIPLFLMLAFRREVADAFRIHDVGAHLTRGAIGASGMLSGFIALTLLPLADAVAIGYATPLMVVALAALILGETVRVYRWTAVAVGFLGVLVILYPHLGAASGGPAGDKAVGALFGLAGAVCAAFATIHVRRLVDTETTASIVFMFMALCAALALVTWPLGLLLPIGAWRAPTPAEGVLLVAIGVLGGLGQMFLTQSYKHADASLVAPFEYFSMIWAIALGYLIFSDMPSAYVLTGSAVVVASGLFVIWRERQLGLERARQREVTTPQG